MTLQEIQYKAQSIIHKWRDDDSAPYVEFVEELAHMIVPEPSTSGSSEIPNDLEEAADEYLQKVKAGFLRTLEHPTAKDCFIAGAKWMADHTHLPEDPALFNKGVEEGRRLAEEEQADLFTIVALDAAQRAKEQMIKKAVEGEVIAVVIHDNGDEIHYSVTYPFGERPHSMFDKVKMIFL